MNEENLQICQEDREYQASDPREVFEEQDDYDRYRDAEDLTNFENI